MLYHFLIFHCFTEPVPEFTGELTVAGAVWQDELADTNSQQFQQLAQSVQTEVGFVMMILCCLFHLMLLVQRCQYKVVVFFFFKL